MKNLLLFAVLVSLPLFLGGCGEKEESVAEVGPVEEKQEVKEEGKPEEPIAETKPKLEGVNLKELEIHGNIFNEIAYHKGSPYTGKSFELYDNGQKITEENWKDGEQEGLTTGWYENGRKSSEIIYKDGKHDGLWSEWYENGQKKFEGNFKDGKADEPWVLWHENGQKKWEVNFKDGKKISQKYWNSKGEPVDSEEEAIK
ncbi:MAG: hypothetical protein GWP42_12810 [Verrucomicrobiales bacterium]|nr:hypothetical protein [Verrucomicrobiales bacterium]